jgi:hypothetical protein
MAAEVRRANQLIYDQITALETFTGDSDAWWQKNFRRLAREFNSDLKYRVFRLMCRGLAERRLDEALSLSLSLLIQFLMDAILINMQLIFSMEYMLMRIRKVMK